MSLQRFLTGIALAFTAFLIFWFARHALPPPIKFKPLNQGTNYSAQGITLVQLRKSGHIRYRLKASHLAHTLPNRYTHLTNPVLVVYPKQRHPAKLQSPTAIVLPGNTTIQMPKRVIITQKNMQGQTMHVISSDVTVDTNQQTATSPASTRVEGPSYVTQGIGLQANFKLQIFNLLKNVHSVYTQPASTR